MCVCTFLNMSNKGVALRTKKSPPRCLVPSHMLPGDLPRTGRESLHFRTVNMRLPHYEKKDSRSARHLKRLRLLNLRSSFTSSSVTRCQIAPLSSSPPPQLTSEQLRWRWQVVTKGPVQGQPWIGIGTQPVHLTL